MHEYDHYTLIFLTLLIFPAYSTNALRTLRAAMRMKPFILRRRVDRQVFPVICQIDMSSLYMGNDRIR